MFKTIERLTKKLKKATVNVAEVEEKLQLAWNKMFKKLPQLLEAAELTENSKEFAWDSCAEIVSWTRFDLTDFQHCKEYLTNYMREYHFIDIDWENDALYYNIGPAIVINGSGDVYDQDSGKFFIDSNDYKDDNGELNESKRNKLIEAYMEKTGCFPAVFSADSHGNVFIVNTKE